MDEVSDKTDPKAQTETWSHLEERLQDVASVERVRVIGDRTPSEIHVLAAATRPAKEIAREVHSLASTTLSAELDSRIVSVVQLDNDVERSEPPRYGRPVLDSVVVATKQTEGWVKLRLRCPDGTIAEGSASATATREGRAYAATDALLQALQGVLAEMEAHVELENVILYPAGTDGLVLIQGTFVDRTQRRPVSGTAFIVDDTATAAARALLDALNRQLRFGSV